MKATENFLTNNACYKAAKRLRPAGIIVHSTACPGVMAGTFLKSWNVEKPGGRSVCVHAFVDHTGVYQTLPWTYQCWGCGSGSKGSGNSSHLQFELCEPKDYGDRAYFTQVRQVALELCVQLCRAYHISPDAVIDHREASKKGIASNHSDVGHWWSKVGYTMDDFRKAIKSGLNGIPAAKPDWRETARNTLLQKGYITDRALWSNYEEDVTKAQAVRLIDSLTGGTWASEEADQGIHWAQPGVISLCGKGIISNAREWIRTLDHAISKALCMALVDKATDGTLEKYKNRPVDHWGRNYLDSLCDKGIISSPEQWTDFEATVSRGAFMTLCCKAFFR